MTTLTFSNACLLLSASGLAGALNGVAGGGSFISFPALIFAGFPSLKANATNNTVTWMGYLASIRAYRCHMSTPRWQLLGLASISSVGGVIGAMLLLRTPQPLFTKLVPYLLLVATVLFTLNSYLANWRQPSHSTPAKSSPHSLMLVGLLQFLVAIYGGFFGGGSGIVMLATFSLLEMKNIHAMNALKTTLNACINGVAMIAFIAAHTIDWQAAFLMSCGSFLGGYWGVYAVRQLDAKFLRGFITLVGLSLTIYFFVQS
ncbi:MAG: sulfite exporter TauE/SafE family protein [Chroococcidiopsidaceae cyanobacterium CP_BM_ER_R8_30]|nr:sulfite exporter TauE/SafE family protein [Chroococcidiopsidaceae cyanobacterium CP_BM_ER_R8_30]